MVEKVADLARKYAEAMESMKDVRSEITDAVIKYLLLNSARYERCTQLAISEELGIPLSTVRRLLMDLEEDRVVKSREVGQAKPYSVAHLGYAMDRGYVSFNRKEIEEVLSPKEHVWEKPPKPISLTSAYLSDGNREGDKVSRYLTPGSKLAADVLIGRFIGYLPARPIDEAMRQAFSEEELNDMRLLFPESGLFSAFQSSGALWPWSPPSAHFERETEPSTRQVRELVRGTFKEKVIEALDRLEAFKALLEEAGWSGVAARETTHYYEKMLRGPEYPAEYRFRKEYVYGTTYTIRQGLRIAQTLDVEKELVQKVDELCSAINIATELEYSGVEEDGPIREWAKKQTAQ